MTDHIESGLDLIIPVVITTFPSMTLHLVEENFVLVLDISNLIVDVFFKSRDDLFKPRELRLDGSIGLGHVFDNHRFYFL